MVTSMTDKRHRQICGPDALVTKTKPKNVKMREEEGSGGAQEKKEVGNASNEASALLEKGKKDDR